MYWPPALPPAVLHPHRVPPPPHPRPSSVRSSNTLNVIHKVLWGTAPGCSAEETQTFIAEKLDYKPLPFLIHSLFSNFLSCPILSFIIFSFYPESMQASSIAWIDSPAFF